VDEYPVQNVEHWILLSVEQDTEFSDVMQTVKCSSMKYSVHSDSIKVAHHASSWNRIALTTNNVSTPDIRRSGIIYPSSVFQDVTASSIHHETGAATIHERRSLVEDATADGDYSVSYWYTLGIFDAESYSITSRVDAKQAERLAYALASLCISVQTASSFIQSMRFECEAPLSIVQLSRAVRETLVLRACAIAHNCDAANPTAIQHAGTVGIRTCSYLHGKGMGYPPRVG
jgi:hypothetical protein